MKSIILKALIYMQVAVYFLEALFQYFFEPIRRIFSPDDDAYPDIGIQPYNGDYYSKWE